MQHKSHQETIRKVWRKCPKWHMLNSRKAFVCFPHACVGFLRLLHLHAQPVSSCQVMWHTHQILIGRKWNLTGAPCRKGHPTRMESDILAYGITSEGTHRIQASNTTNVLIMTSIKFEKKKKLPWASNPITWKQLQQSVPMCCSQAGRKPGFHRKNPWGSSEARCRSKGRGGRLWEIACLPNCLPSAQKRTVCQKPGSHTCQQSGFWLNAERIMTTLLNGLMSGAGKESRESSHTSREWISSA